MDAKTVFTFFGGVIAGLILGVMIFGGGPKGGSAPVATPTAPQQPQVDRIKLQRQIAQLEELVKTDPGNYQAWKQMGNNLFDIGEHAKSIEAYSKALAIDGSDPNVWTDMGIMHRQLSQFDKALEAFEKAAELGPNHPMSRLNRGIVLYFDLNRTDEAIAAWEDVLRIQPSGPQADNARQLIAQAGQAVAPAPTAPPIPPDFNGELPPDHPPTDGSGAAQPQGGAGGDPAGYGPKPE